MMGKKSLVDKAENIKTKTLFLLGEKDRRCPARQTEIFSDLINEGEKKRRKEENKDKGEPISIVREFLDHGHSLNSVEAEIHSLFAMSEWWIDNFNF